MKEQIRQYRRDLALAVLSNQSGPISAAQVCQSMEALSRAELHPEACWRGLDAPEVAGILRSLEAQGQVEKEEGAHHNTRHGRPEPGWELAAPNGDYPVPPEPDLRPRAAAAQAPADEFSGLSRAELVALLTANNDLLLTVSKFLEDISAAKIRARQQLAAAGLVDAE